MNQLTLLSGTVKDRQNTMRGDLADFGHKISDGKGTWLPHDGLGQCCLLLQRFHGPCEMRDSGESSADWARPRH